VVPAVFGANPELSNSVATSRVGTYGQFGLGVAGQVIDTGWLGYARLDYRTGENIEGVSGNIGLRYQLQPEGPSGSLKDGPAPRRQSLHNWTGFYAGGFAGATWGDQDVRSVTFGTTVEPEFQGYLLGGEAGYNYQAGVWVIGVEGDIGTSNAEGGKSCPNAFFFTCKAEVENLASIAGRFGYAWERTLFFLKGGVAFGEVTAGTSNNSGLFPGVAASTTEWQTGWTLGGGAEFALTSNWSAKGEWMYYDLGSETFVVDTLGTGVVDAKTRGEAVRVGLNYHFGP
jgi:opacity protein-like surface antigen